MTSPAWASTRRILLHGGTVHSTARPSATSLLVDGDRIAWLGDESAAQAHRDSADEIIDLRGALVTPGFVDAHVHATSTGMTLAGLDLRECASLAEALAVLESRARAARGGVIIGHGWDETGWPEARPPSRSEIDRATWGSVVYLSRIDVHSAAVSSALAAMVPQLPGLGGFDPQGPLTREAHHAVREAALGTVGHGQRRLAQRRAREHAASLGIVAMHEMAGPTISSEADLSELLALSAAEPGPLVTGYWGELASTGGIERARSLGAHGAAGDLFVDGAIGSRTARLCRPYADASDTKGAAYLDAGDVADHVTAATHAGLQAGFHVIGDEAGRIAIEGLREASRRVGLPAMRAASHRLEHVEMVSLSQITALAELGVTASVQPMFDALWGGAGGMYEQRLGAERASAMNAFADLVSAGVLVAFGSDAPVTELGPWRAVAAAMHHGNPAQSLTADAAFSAHTRAGWLAVGDHGSGVLAPDTPAHLAVWACDGPGLPALSDAAEDPRCLLTMVAGRAIFDSGDLGT